MWLERAGAKIVGLFSTNGTDFVSIPEAIGREIEKSCQNIFPLQNCFIRKVKILKFPKFDVQKFLEMHPGDGDDVGSKVDRRDFKEPAILAEV